MALEGSDRVTRHPIEIPCGRDRVAVAREQLLRFLDHRIGFPEHENGTGLRQRRGLDPTTDAGIRQHLPGKFLARILLARGCNIGMGEHPVGRNLVTGEDAAAERGDRCDLTFGKIGITVIVPRIGDLDSDRA